MEQFKKKNLIYQILPLVSVSALILSWIVLSFYLLYSRERKRVLYFMHNVIGYRQTLLEWGGGIYIICVIH